jgi:nucleoside-diphosphate kinase
LIEKTVRLPGVKRTLFIIKPDGVERGLVGEILSRLEAKQLRIVAAEFRTIDEATAREHYAEHEGKPYYDPLVSFITRGPSLVMVVEGPDDTWKVVRTMMGSTNPADAAPGTIRGDLAIGMPDNLTHGSDSADSAQREIKIFFSHLN